MLIKYLPTYPAESFQKYFLNNNDAIVYFVNWKYCHSNISFELLNKHKNLRYQISQETPWNIIHGWAKVGWQLWVLLYYYSLIIVFFPYKQLKVYIRPTLYWKCFGIVGYLSLLRKTGSDLAEGGGGFWVNFVPPDPISIHLSTVA